MKTITTEIKTGGWMIQHQEWRILPDVNTPNHFNMEEVKTAKVFATFIPFESRNRKLLNLMGCIPELEDIAEMYYASVLGNPDNSPSTASGEFKQVIKHREQQWQLIPDINHTDSFWLKEARTGSVLGTFLLPEGGTFKTLYRITTAPKLEHIAKTYDKQLSGSAAKDSIVFAVVKEVLRRLEQENPYTISP